MGLANVVPRRAGRWGCWGPEPEAQHQGTVYLKAAAIGMPFWSMLLRLQRFPTGRGRYADADGDRSDRSTSINIIVAYTLINGAGAGSRTGRPRVRCGFTAAAIIGADADARSCWRQAPSRFTGIRGEGARWSLRCGGGVLSTSASPPAIEQAQFNIAFMLYTRIIASLGTTALAAHGVTLAIQSLTFNVGFGLSVATTALVGQSLGAKRPGPGRAGDVG